MQTNKEEATSANAGRNSKLLQRSKRQYGSERGVSAQRCRSLVRGRGARAAGTREATFGAGYTSRTIGQTRDSDDPIDFSLHVALAVV